MTSESPHPTLGRVLLRAYAVIAGIAGFGALLLLIWGPRLFGAYVLGSLTASGVPVRLLSPVLVTFGCWAASLSRVEDPWQRSKLVGWFAIAHYLLFFVAYVQAFAFVRPKPLVGRFFGIACTTTSIILNFTNRRRPKRKLGGKSLTKGIGRHEQQIRQAAAQQERNRLARDLHDSIKQQIFVIQTAAATAQTRLDGDRPGAETAIGEIRESARSAMTEMEAMLDQLRAVPLSNDGLVESIRKQCEALELRTGAKVEFQLIELPPADTLAPGAHEAVLRVVQEALANIGRHARASHVTVSLDSFSDTLKLCIRDDGSGFNQFEPRQGMGMRNMRERSEELGGKLDINSRPGDGAQVLLSIPHDEIPTEYRFPTYLLAAGLVFLLIAAVLTWSGPWSIVWAMPIAVCGRELLRCIGDWRQARKYAGAAA